MSQSKTLVIKLFTINRHAAGAITFEKVAALQHEIFNDAVERAVFVPNWLVILFEFTSTKLSNETKTIFFLKKLINKIIKYRIEWFCFL